MILTCPFCGSKPVLVYRKLFKEYFVHCTNKECATLVGRMFSSADNKFIKRTQKEAVDLWNSNIQRTETEIVIREI